MARPSKRTVDYFPHYCNHKKTLMMLETRYGNDGYTFWFKLLEILGKSDGHSFRVDNPIELEYLAANSRITAVSASEILDYCASLHAIDPELWKHKVIWSQNFVDNLAELYKKRSGTMPEKPIIEEFPTRKPPDNPQGEEFPTRKPPDNSVKVGGNPQTKLNKIKEEKIDDYILNMNSFGKAIYEKLPRVRKLGIPTNEQIDKLLGEFGKDLVWEKLLAMENYKDLEKYESTYLTLRNWCSRTNGVSMIPAAEFNEYVHKHVGHETPQTQAAFRNKFKFVEKDGQKFWKKKIFSK